MKDCRQALYQHVAVLSLTWGLVHTGPLSVLLLPIVVWLVWQCVRRRKFVRATVALLLCPLGAAYIDGCSDYFQGTATLVTAGKPDAKSRGLHRETRAQNGAGGCLSDGSEWVRRAPYRGAVSTMAALFGPMPASYAGEFPDEVNARLVLDGGERAVVRGNDLELEAGRFALAPAVAIWLRQAYFDAKGNVPLEHLPAPLRRGALRGELYGEHVIVVGNDEGAVLIDRESGRAFAYYGSFTADDLPPRWRDS